jgi:hypothetical protein
MLINQYQAATICNGSAATGMVALQFPEHDKQKATKETKVYFLSETLCYLRFLLLI